MQTNQAPPAYAPVDDAPPAYAPSFEGPTPQQAQPVQAYQPPSQQTPQQPQVVYQQQQQPQPQVMYQQPMQQVPAGQPVVYMMQQPDGSLVPMQAAPGGGVPTVSTIPGTVQTVQTVPQQHGISSVAPGTMAMGPGAVTTTVGATNIAPGTNTVITQSRSMYAPRAADPFNRRIISWAVGLVILFYCLQIYATAADSLTVYLDADGDFDAYFRHDRLYYDWGSVSYGSSTYKYSEGCDDGSDDYCDWESAGGVFNTLLVINNIIGVFIASILINILGKCCQCCGTGEKTVRNQINVSKGGLVLMILFFIIGMISWGSSPDPCEDVDDDDGDCGWGATMWVVLFCIIGYSAALAILFRK